ncbi:hypothetical protein N7481_012262 [Penicillium waksmanii]|uniref:uncharacterized protein n=1 Tax=Penicillium waksmanii TaxID=69791 RepID=UPI0025475FD5|nr:uncharacterized protein N7481_012262 [Penicillium waksmanii]KAJ5965548.1 hypothetical protein N7481_012262 [Penicillium waksmanii]
MADNESLVSRSSSTSSTSSKWAKMQSQLHTPMPSSLSGECAKAEKILRSFLYPKSKKAQDEDTELGIPRAILSRAKGLAVCTATKAGIVGSFRFGSGLIVVRLEDGSWSAPSAMSTGGIGLGTQIGFEKTDFVFVLNSEKAIKAFTKTGSITLGKNLSVALGPYGRSAEFSGVLSSKGLAGMFAYSKSRGIFGGKSWEGGIIGERPEANKKMYGITISASELLSGKVEPPPEAGPLMEILNSEKFRIPDDEIDVSPMASTEQLARDNHQGDSKTYHEELAKGIHQEVPGFPVELSAEPKGQFIAELPADMPFELPTDIPGNFSKNIGEPSLEDPARFNELDAGPVNEVFELPAEVPFFPKDSQADDDTPNPVERNSLQPLPLRIQKRGGTS